MLTYKRQSEDGSHFDFQTTWPKDKIRSHKILGWSWESVGVDICTIYNKNYLCIVDYQNISTVIKQMEGFNADNLMKTYKIIFSEYRLLSKIVSDMGTNFVFRKV